MAGRAVVPGRLGAGLALVAALAPLVLGGIHLRVETAYQPASPDGPVELHVQNSERSSWGIRDYVSGDTYEAPFDLYVSGESPDADGEGLMILDRVTVSDGATELRRAGPIEVPLDPAVVRQGAAETPVRAASFVLRDAIPSAGPRLTLRATGRIATAGGTRPFDVAHVVERVHGRTLHVGARALRLD